MGGSYISKLNKLALISTGNKGNSDAKIKKIVGYVSDGTFSISISIYHLDNQPTNQPSDSQRPISENIFISCLTTCLTTKRRKLSNHLSNYGF